MYFAGALPMRSLIVAVSLAALAAPLPALAQDVSDTEIASAEIERTLGDPATQDAMADGIAAASEALLDVPLAPMARAVARAAGEDPRYVDPDMTLRGVSPDTQDLPKRVRAELPRMMGAMAGMAGGIGAMVPALREMADRMREAVDQAGAAVPRRY
jgi:hypothetical protein